MAELAKNQLYYQTLVQRINGKFNSIKMVVKGGR
jgi:flagellar basal-body rod protein FlgB